MTKFCNIERCWFVLVTYLHNALKDLVFLFIDSYKQCILHLYFLPGL